MSWTLRAGRRELAIPMHAFVVGRGRDADLQLDDESVSRRHAKLAVMSDGEPAIEDLGSQNGTFINGKAIVGSARLHVGDRITLGSCDLEVLATYAPNPLGYERATEPLTRERISREPPSKDLLSVLSKREREIFVLLAEGIAQREIAQSFGVSTKTIETHRTRIGQKLQIKTRADLIRIALATGVLRPDNKA
jgi:pSer/pThr/pTyr-binding forkhead associated (FHA) protein